MNNEINLDDFCSLLSINRGTGKNWVKLGKISPTRIEKDNVYFDEEYALKVVEDIKSGDNKALRSRRNKKYVTGLGLYHQYISRTNVNAPIIFKLIDDIKKSNLELTNKEISIIIADAALFFLAKDGKRISLYEYISDKNKKDIYGDKTKLIDDLIPGKQETVKFCKEHGKLLNLPFCLDEKYSEDLLGLMYISCRNLRQRKAKGAYYTPTTVVRKLVENISKSDDLCREDIKILDPCLGSGNFLLQLDKRISPYNIYGYDIDEISVKIARINLAIRYPECPVHVLMNNIKNEDFLLETTQDFDIILGNPPWGYDFSKEERIVLKEKFGCVVTSNMESYDLFVEKALMSLKIGGKISFVLPMAFLSVKTHKKIREIILEECNIKSVIYLGDVFDKVNCPSIILEIEKTGKKCDIRGLCIEKSNENFVINTSRRLDAECFSFSINDEDYEILEKMKTRENIVYLKDNAEFAMGIVTGDNKRFLANEKKSGMERIYKGQNIVKYGYADNNELKYIAFDPSKYQQVAKVDLYRADEKLLYRFISGELVFAYDDKRRLSLNSCNVLIPHLKGISIKYVLGLLNSRLADFWFQKEFNSVKVLKSHLERFPIPVPTGNEHDKVVELVDKLLLRDENYNCYYDELESVIRKIYHL